MTDCTKDCAYTCTLEFPKAFKDQLTASLGVDLLENPNHEPVNIIKVDQSYTFRVYVELNAAIKKLICAEWCICVASESIGDGPEGQICKKLQMDNCNPKCDYIDIEVSGKWLAGHNAKCGQVSHIVVTVVALDQCEHKPIGIAGFCKVGPIMVFGD